MLFGAALAAVNGRDCLRKALPAGRAPAEDTWVLAVGKAAGAMTLGALDALGPAVSRALVISRQGHFEPELLDQPAVRCLTGGHPLPDEDSLQAGAAALAMAGEAPPGQRVLLLVSGGASSLMEVLPAGVSLQALRDLNAWASSSGVDIGTLNALRRSLSRVKGGRLLEAFAHCRAEGFYISDVPGDDPAVVASGLLTAAPVPNARVTLPDWLPPLLARAPPAAAAGAHGPPQCVAGLTSALQAARDAAIAAQAPVTVHAARLEGDAEQVAGEVCSLLREGAAGVHVFGGETTVRLPRQPGRGGRNQHLALAAAQCIEGDGQLLLLACGTDGSDGNTDDAGALVDGGTLQRGRDGGFGAGSQLAAADSGRFLEASGDLVHTGPTGTNVGDLLIAWKGELLHSSSAPG